MPCPKKQRKKRTNSHSEEAAQHLMTGELVAIRHNQQATAKPTAKFCRETKHRTRLESLPDACIFLYFLFGRQLVQLGAEKCALLPGRDQIESEQANKSVKKERTRRPRARSGRLAGVCKIKFFAHRKSCNTQEGIRSHRPVVSYFGKRKTEMKKILCEMQGSNLRPQDIPGANNIFFT